MGDGGGERKERWSGIRKRERREERRGRRGREG